MNSQNCLFSELYETQKYSQWKNVKILIFNEVWCDFDRASSLICGNKMPTRCNRDFYYRYYCLLNMFRAPLCPSSGAQEYYTVVAAYGIWCCGFQVVGLVWSWGLCESSILQTGHITLNSTPDQHLENHSTKCHRQQPLYNTLELLMMGIVVPETCWASNKMCNKNLCCI